MFHDTEEWRKIWRKTNLLFKKWQEFWSKHSKVSKISNLFGPFRAKYIMFDLKKYRGVILHDTGEWCKIRWGIDLSLQNWLEEFNKFWPKHLKISNIRTLMSCFWPKYIMFELKRYREVMFDGTEGWCKVWRKTDICCQKWHEESGKFSSEHSKV